VNLRGVVGRSSGALGRLMPKSSGGRTLLGVGAALGGFAGYHNVRQNRANARFTKNFADNMYTDAQARLDNMQLIEVDQNGNPI